MTRAQWAKVVASRPESTQERVRAVRRPKTAKKAAGAPQRSKYGAVRTGKYASKKEAARAAELRLLEKAGEIRNLREQVAYELIPKQEGERALTYVADFVYERVFMRGDGIPYYAEIIEDCKGFRTQVYRIKRKLMLFRHNLPIYET